MSDQYAVIHRWLITGMHTQSMCAEPQKRSEGVPPGRPLGHRSVYNHCCLVVYNVLAVSLYGNGCHNNITHYILYVRFQDLP